MSYIARCQHLLQQGRFVADICYLAPEKAPLRWQPPHPTLDRPRYNFDGCPPEVVLNRMTVKEDRLVLPDGMSYRVLALPEGNTMTPRLLGRIKELVEAGATVVGLPPASSPSLTDYPQCDSKTRRLASELWGDIKGTTNHEHRLGKGRVVWGRSPEEVLADASVPPDFVAQPDYSSQRLRYIHKTLGDRDVYFIANARAQPEEARCSFRVTGKVPEFWWPDTGRAERPAVFYEATNGVTQMPIRLDPAGAVFVVFRPAVTGGPVGIAEVARLSDRASLRENEHARNLATTGEATNSFAIAGWVKPEASIDLPAEAAAGSSGLNVKRNDALYPPPGHEVYPEPGQAGAGFSVGTNGVCVFEHGCGHFAPVLLFATPITGWTHLAVVYREGKPSLFLNGKFVHEGLKSAFAVHPGVGVQHWRNPPPFIGDLGEFEKFDSALSADEIAALARETPIPGSISTTPGLELSRDEKGGVRVEAWQVGKFEIATKAGGKFALPSKNVPPPMGISGPWDLSFPPGWGAPAHVTLDKLISWRLPYKPGGEVLFRDRDLYENRHHPRRPARQRPTFVSGPRQGGRHGPSELERPGPGDALEAALPGRHYRASQEWRQRAEDSSGEPLGESNDWR